ncbi:hypothetical protein MSIBF_A2540005 [groundwater metagenome]|uniref:ISXO2-like transposase domain-containing protein n=1 Tax=groundwater metagenome TaxID=717931 RepID=A0A098EC73_9ZZZZ
MEKIPQRYQENSVFYTDDWDAYKGVIPEKQHIVADKKSGRQTLLKGSIVQCVNGCQD